MSKVILFSGESCSACKSLKTYADSKGYDIADTVYIDSETGSYRASQYRIRSIPTLVRLDDNDHIESMIVGFQAKEVDRFFN